MLTDQACRDPQWKTRNALALRPSGKSQRMWYSAASRPGGGRGDSGNPDPPPPPPPVWLLPLCKFPGSGAGALFFQDSSDNPDE
jgi:hypothetical protein